MRGGTDKMLLWHWDDVLARSLAADQQEYDDTVAAVLAADEEVKAGQTQPLEEAWEALRVKHGLPR